MPKASNPSRKISFSPISASVRSGKNGAGALFDVTFTCTFTKSSTDGIRLGHKEVLMVMQLAESAYPEIVRLLANKPKAKRQGK